MDENHKSCEKNVKSCFKLSCFKLFCINIQSVRYKKSEFEAFLYDINADFDIICLTEHWLTKSELKHGLNIGAWNLASNFSRTEATCGGILILAGAKVVCEPHNVINALSVELHCEISSVIIKVSNLVIVNVYRPPSGNFNIFISIVENILLILNLPYKNVLFCGDFNVKFGSGDNRDNTLCDIFKSFGFMRTIFTKTHIKNCLDNIFLNFSTEDFNVSTIDSNMSGHLGLSMEVLLKSYQDEYTVKKCRPITEKGYNSFYCILGNLCWDYLYVDGEINYKLNTFLENFCDAFQLAFPEVRITARKQDADIKWFSSELKSMRNHLALLNEMYSKYKTIQLLEQRNKFRFRYKSAIKNAKINANNDFIHNSGNPVSAMWKIVNAKRGIVNKSS